MHYCKCEVLVVVCLFICLFVDQLEEWSEVSRICLEKKHCVMVDMAYQGFATGELDRDAAGLRKLVADGHKVVFCQSFSKNMGLYGKGWYMYEGAELCGTWGVVCRANKVRDHV